jgi:hypothetical protein
LIVLLVVAICFTAVNQRALNESHEVRYKSHLLAQELRQSSDDLTRLARTYVVTGDNSYENNTGTFSRSAMGKNRARTGVRSLFQRQ